jgi:hypothetical protein
MKGVPLNLTLQGLCLIDEHNRYAVADLVQQLAAVADQSILCLVEPNGSLAFGAGENVEQVLADTHAESLVRNEKIHFLFALRYL